MKLYLLPILGWLCYFSLVLNSSTPFYPPPSSSNKLDIAASDFSSSQLYIKINSSFDFDIEEEDVGKNIALQKMLFELHKLVRGSEVISVKKPDIQPASNSSSIYVFEFDTVNNINDLAQKIQDLYFIDYVRKVPIK